MSGFVTARSLRSASVAGAAQARRGFAASSSTWQRFRQCSSPLRPRQSGQAGCGGCPAGRSLCAWSCPPELCRSPFVRSETLHARSCRRSSGRGLRRRCRRRRRCSARPSSARRQSGSARRWRPAARSQRGCAPSGCPPSGC
eukprot:365329-Chlamydomonas_euryale.AAC.7